MRRAVVTVFQIVSHFNSLCSECQCRIPKGHPCIWHKDTGKVHHRDGECGRAYRVAAIFRSTRKVIQVNALTVEEALETARRKLGKPVRIGTGFSRDAMASRAGDRPERYIAYQGDVPIMEVAG